jgi:putative transposase
MSHTCGNILLHMIFSTRERRPLIKPEFRDDLFAYLGGIIRQMNGTALIVGGTADHVHMFVRIRPAQSPAEIARTVKTNSSRWIRERSPISVGKPDTEFSASASRTCPP